MTESADSSQLRPADLIEQAIGIVMRRFDLDAAHALQVLQRMSQNTEAHPSVVAEQIINHNVPVEAFRGLEEEFG
jgi:AmiR/NasT family two-component response regulator